jgi:hypothetical protein
MASLGDMYDPNNPVPCWSTSTMRRVAAEPSLADAALRYANLGVPVFPCAPGGKQPLTPNGFHDATSLARIVAHWWERHPDANIGLPTGVTTGVLVVDVDVHGGESGYAAFERSRAAGLTEGWGWLVRTPSGGLHAYYPAVPEAEQRCWQVPAARVDFRGDGGYVIAPPSWIEVDGRPRLYDVIAVGNHLARRLDATALRQFLEPHRPLRPSLYRPVVGCRPDRLADWVAGRREGGRNGGLFWAACEMVRQGHRDSEIAAVLGPAAQTAGLPEREIQSTLCSASRIAARLSPPPASRPSPTQSSEAIGL